MSVNTGSSNDANGDDDDVVIVKVIPKKKPMTWVSSSFDGFGPDPSMSQKPLNTPKTTEHHDTSRQSATKKSTGIQSSLLSFASEALTRKRPRESVHRLNSRVQTQSQPSLKAALNTDLWSEKYKPMTRGELAVHKKKVDEIAEWLKCKTSSRPISRHAAPILLLTGPPGAGKTACVQLLTAELGLAVQEWSSSSEQAADQWSTGDKERSKVDVYMSQSQSSVFYNFLLRANKYHALDLVGSAIKNEKHSTVISNQISNSKGAGNVIVVEDMPNVFFRDTSQFHEILRKYVYNGHCPLVFILSESNSNSSSIQRLFPKDLQQQLNITNISMNPVAPTVLIKLLNRVVGQEAGQSKFVPPSTSVIETVAMSSSGDVRSALNTLQFACRRDTEDLTALCKTTIKSSLKKKKSESRLKYSKGMKQNTEDSQSEGSSSVLGVKDKSVFLFQAIGDDPKNQPGLPSLPSHINQHERDPLLLDPEDVAHQSHLPGDYFISFLHENYVDFLSSVEDLERATQYFSDSDYFSALWMAREELQNYSVSVATRGFIHSNSEVCQHDSRRKNHGWRPLHKSQWFNASKQANENILSARQLFKGYHWEPETLCTEIIPYISVTNPTLHDAGQITFVQEMTQFSQAKQFFRPKLEQLDERDVLDDCDDTETAQNYLFGKPSMVDTNIRESDDVYTVPSSQTSLKVLETEDDVVIEDIDDEEDDLF